MSNTLPIPFPAPDLAEYMRTPAIVGFHVNQRETRVVYGTNLAGDHYNVWALPLDGSGYPYPLTHHNQVPHALAQDPEGRYVLMAFDTDGDELAQLYLARPEGGTLVPLNPSPGCRFVGPQLSRDGNRLYYSTDRDNRQYLNSCVLDLATHAERVLHEGREGPTFLTAIAPDESSWVVVTARSNTDSRATLITADGLAVPLVPEDAGECVVSAVAYAAPGEVLLATNYGEDRTYLARYRVEAGHLEVLATFPGDVAQLAVHEAGGTVHVLVQDGVADRLFRCRLADGGVDEETLPVTVVDEMQAGASGTLYLVGRSDVTPMNLWRRRPGYPWERLTDHRVMGVAEADLVPAEVLRLASFDGLELEALWFPARPERQNGYTIVWPHGGPQAAERRMFRAFFQFALARGYNILAPNFRGSSGYGADFMKRVNRDWGDGPRRDVLAAVDWVIANGRAAADKLLVVGGSYGGYMTLLLHGRHPDRFRAFVDLFGPSNLLTFAAAVPEFWKPMMKQWLGDPEEDRGRLVADSPITYLDQMTRPMLVIQGANDPRVVKGESDQIVAALRERGVSVDYLVFQDEGHGFMHKANELEAYRRVIDFLDAARD